MQKMPNLRRKVPRMVENYRQSQLNMEFNKLTDHTDRFHWKKGTGSVVFIEVTDKGSRNPHKKVTSVPSFLTMLIPLVFCLFQGNLSNW